MNSKRRQSAMIEGLEQRTLFSASQLTETIVSSTLPTANSDQATLKGVVSLQVSNNSGVAQKFKGQLGIYIADQVLNIPSNAWSILRSQPTAISLAIGQSKVFKIGVSVPKGKLTDGTDTLFGVVTDTTGTYSQSPAGPTLLVHVPIVALSETEVISKLPSSTVVAAALRATDRVTITNSGTDPFSGSLTIALLAAPHDTISGATTFTSLVRKLTIPAGRKVVVALPLRTDAALSPGAYQLISAVTQPNGTVTSTNPATAPVFTIQAPIVTPEFVETIASADGVYATDKSDTSAQHITQLDISMNIQNNGTSAIGSDQFTLFASTSPTLDSSAIEEESVPLTQNIPYGTNRAVQIDFGIPDNGPDNGTVVNYYIFVQVTDTSGDVTVASYPTQVSFAGPNGG